VRRRTLLLAWSVSHLLPALGLTLVLYFLPAINQLGSEAAGALAASLAGRAALVKPGLILAALLAPAAAWVSLTLSLEEGSPARQRPARWAAGTALAVWAMMVTGAVAGAVLYLVRAPFYPFPPGD